MEAISLDSKIDQNASEFLTNHQLSPSDFAGDRRAMMPFTGAYRADVRQLNQLGQKNKTLYGNNPAVDQSINQQQDLLMKKYQDKARLHSIEQTLNTYQQNPRSFDSALSASRDAEYELGAQKYDTAGAATGALSGAVIGNGLASIGARMNKVNPKFFGPIGAVGGLVGGALIGHQAGRKANEHITGRQYTEIQTPYEIAQKMKHDAT